MSTHLDKYEDVAAVVCGKPRGLGHEACFSSRKDGFPPCRGYGKCCLFDKSEQQLSFVLHPLETEVFLKACPGSGKTEVVGLMAAYAMRRSEWRQQGIAILSFTNNATDVIRERVQRFAGNTGFPHYIGTFDSWLHGYLVNPYGHLVTKFVGNDGDRSVRIVEQDSQAAFTKAFTCKTPYVLFKQSKSRGGKPSLTRLPLAAHQYHFDLREDAFFIVPPYSKARSCIKDEALYSSVAFKEFCEDRQWLSLQKFREDLAETKAAFWKKGHATHEDVEVICFLLLTQSQELRKRFAERFPFIIVDECQDLSGGQMRLLNILRDCGSKVHLAGDLHQSIFSFRGVYPENLLSFVEQGKYQLLHLTKNFRSVQPIVDVCGKLRAQGNIVGLAPESEEPACVYFPYEEEDMAGLSGRFMALAASRGCCLERTAILARGHSTLRKLTSLEHFQPDNLSVRLALAIYQWTQLTGKALEEPLRCLGLVIGSWCFPSEAHDSRNQFRPYTVSSNIEWRLFLTRVLDGCAIHPNVGNLSQTWRIWAGEARRGLGTILTGAWKGSDPLPNFAINVLALRNAGDSLVCETLGFRNCMTQCKLRVATFHQIKGETLEAALVVSSPTRRGDGGHWLQWVVNAGGDGEHARFAYVASSRPRRLLAWAVPEPDSDQKQTLGKLGFLPAC